VSSGGMQVFCQCSQRLRSCQTGPRARECGLGPWRALFPAAAGPGERPGRVKDRAEPGRPRRRR
jgi:hypothetical protein